MRKYLRFSFHFETLFLLMALDLFKEYYEALRFGFVNIKIALGSYLIFFFCINGPMSKEIKNDLQLEFSFVFFFFKISIYPIKNREREGANMVIRNRYLMGIHLFNNALCYRLFKAKEGQI